MEPSACTSCKGEIRQLLVSCVKTVGNSVTLKSNMLVIEKNRCVDYQANVG